ncbi:MAG: hypothetical protein WBA31_08675 [Candidatus Dormiibacterota bacterium]
MSDTGRAPDPWPVRVAGTADEEDPRLLADPRGGLQSEPGEITLLLLRSTRGVTLGTALVRRPQVVAEIRRIPGIGAVRTSTLGGTVGPGGEHWIGFLAAARLPDPCPRPLDRLTDSLRAYLEDRLRPFAVHLTKGRVDRAWCPGFSDLAVGGRKLAGLGMRLTGGWGLVRGVVAVSPPSPEELRSLDLCHRVFGSGVDAERLISLAEIDGLAGIDREGAVRLLGNSPQTPAKMSA